jgi:tRNA A37 threonylcarbamoyladenosine biosynthesis protein TsaE
MEEYLSSGNYCFIEWPELAYPLYPENCVVVKITVVNKSRIIEASVNE